MLVAVDFSRDSFNLKSSISKYEMSPDKENSATDSESSHKMWKWIAISLEGKSYQAESKVDSYAL